MPMRRLEIALAALLAAAAICGMLASAARAQAPAPCGYYACIETEPSGSSATELGAAR